MQRDERLAALAVLFSYPEDPIEPAAAEVTSGDGVEDRGESGGWRSTGRGESSRGGDGRVLGTPVPRLLAAEQLCRQRAGRFPEGLPVALADRLAATPRAALQAEYVRLFINAVPEVLCPPYASIYLHGRLLGDAAAVVRGMYRRWGVDTDELPDHFAAECAFLGCLLPRAAEDPAARADGRELLHHLHQWTPLFLARIEAHDSTGVYAAGAQHARQLLAELSREIAV